MGKKYSINSAGYIVAERDIYSLGGFIPKGSVGGKVASGKQLSQDGECWLAGGDISGRPDVRIKDNAFIGNFFVSSSEVHTDGVTEFSGNTLIPGKIIVRNPIADPINNFYAKDSFIGVSVDALCGSATGTNFPFEQGLYSVNSAKGTLFANMVAAPTPVNSCRGIAALRLGKDTKLYVPAGLRCQALWGYYNATGQEAYSGRYTEYAPGLHTISDPVCGIARLHFWKSNGEAMTPANLLATGAKILGHISQSANVDIRPGSASGSYVMVNSSFIAETDNFGLNTTQLRFLAGSMYDTTMYTKTDRQDYKPYGTFRNVERLEYTKYLGDSHRTAATRDTYISAYDCPLLRVDGNTFDNLLAGKGDLVLRNCIVPKAWFAHDPINGNTYDGIDFSYANEDIGFPMTGYAVFYSSNKQGLYRVKAGEDITQGLVSHKGNLEASARLYPDPDSIPLDGSIVEQGTYYEETVYYENAKHDDPTRVRTKVPLPTKGAIFPTLPTGFGVSAILYLDENFVCKLPVTEPTTIETTYPYYVIAFRREDLGAALTVKDFIALGLSLSMTNYGKVPEVTGSAYAGAGATVCGDVKLIGDPYINRVFDVDMWERGTTGDALGTWDDMTKGNPLPHRYRLVDTIPVEPGGSIECGEAYYIECNIFDINGRFLHRTGWTKSYSIPENGAFLGLVLRLVSDGLVENSDIPVANVKYVRAFEKRRYITNELDRTSPEDILLGPDFFEQGSLAIAEWNTGKPYEELKIGSPYRIRLKRPFGLGAGYRATFSSVYSFGSTYYDAATKLLYGSTSADMNNALFSLVGSIADSPTAPIAPADVTAARVVIEFTPTPRIIVPYGLSYVTVRGAKVRMYGNAMLSRNLKQEGEIVLQGNAVLGDVPGGCVCANGHDDAIIKLP
jgi:hypothetical protein